MTKNNTVAECRDCGGRVRYHSIDKTWKHDIPEEAFRCALDRPQNEVYGISRGQNDSLLDPRD